MIGAHKLIEEEDQVEDVSNILYCQPHCYCSGTFTQTIQSNILPSHLRVEFIGFKNRLSCNLFVRETQR